MNLEDFDASQKCQVSDWGPWSDCSSSCDIGAQTRLVGIDYLLDRVSDCISALRSRHYLNPASSADCGEELIQSTQCSGNHPDCPAPGERGHSPAVTGLGYGYGSYGGNKVSG